MTDPGFDYPMLILFTGAVILLNLLLKAGLDRIGMPALVGFLLLGLGIRWVDHGLGILPGGLDALFEFLARVGLVTLLFRIGLESDLGGLLRQLRRASLLWVFNVSVCALAGFAVSYYLLGFDRIPSLVVGAAFTATSVGISVGAWKESGNLDSPNGQLLTDLAELDDIMAVVIMAVLFAVLPAIGQKDRVFSGLLVLRTAGWFFLKLLVFGVLAFLFSRYLEKRLTGLYTRLEPSPDPMLMVVGTALLIAALAGLAGFSLAIGAFFAGLMFSRDPRAVKMEASFLPLYELFSPFFFLGVGLRLQPDALVQGMGPGAVLFLAAVVAKILATGAPAAPMVGPRAGALVGVSMVPRAEIALVIMQKGLALGAWAVTPAAYAAMTVACAGTCLVSPPVVRMLLERWPQGGGDDQDQEET